MNAQALLTAQVIMVGIPPAPQTQSIDRAERVPRLTWVLCAALLLCGCILVSMATTTDPDWWRLYFSRLGMMGDFSSLAFNGGLIVSGAIIACSAWMLRVRLRDMIHATRRSRVAMHLMPYAIVGLGVSLLAIGAYPLSVDPIAHERATNGAVLSFAFLLLSHRVLLWQLAPALQRASVISAVTMIAALVALKAEVISLTVFEATAFAMILWWVHLLEQVAHAHAVPSQIAQPVQVQQAQQEQIAPEQSAPVQQEQPAQERTLSCAAGRGIRRYGRAVPRARATTRPRCDVGKRSSISRSSAASTLAPNASAPGSSMIPDASGPATTASKPRSSTRRATTPRSSGSSPAMAIARRPGDPALRASSSRSW